MKLYGMACLTRCLLFLPVGLKAKCHREARSSLPPSLVIEKKAASLGAIPSRLAPYLRDRVRADFSDARAAEATRHL